MLRSALLFLFVFLLPTQLGKHFFFDFSFVNGVRIDYLAPTLYINDLIFLALMVVEHRAIFSFIRLHFRKFILIGGAFIVNIAVAPEPLIAAYTIARLYQVLFVFVIFVAAKRDITTVLWAFLAGSLIQLGLSAAQFVNHGSLQGPFYFFGERFFTLSTPGIAKASFQGVEIVRPYGTFSHPNSLGGFYALLYAFCLTLLSTKTGRPIRYLVLTLGAVSAMLVFVSFSKAAIGGLIAITIASAIIFRDKKKQCLPCMISRIVVPIVLALLFFQAQGDAYSVDKRFRLIQQSLIMFQQYPLFGIGFGNNLYFQAQFSTPYAEFFLQPVHNIFLLLLSQGGLVITSLVGWAVLPVFKKRAALVILAVLLTGLVDHYWLTLYQNMLVLGVVFGLMWTVEKAKTAH